MRDVETGSCRGVVFRQRLSLCSIIRHNFLSSKPPAASNSSSSSFTSSLFRAPRPIHSHNLLPETHLPPYHRPPFESHVSFSPPTRFFPSSSSLLSSPFFFLSTFSLPPPRSFSPSLFLPPQPLFFLPFSLPPLPKPHRSNRNNKNTSRSNPASKS